MFMDYFFLGHEQTQLPDELHQPQLLFRVDEFKNITMEERCI